MVRLSVGELESWVEAGLRLMSERFNLRSIYEVILDAMWV